MKRLKPSPQTVPGKVARAEFEAQLDGLLAKIDAMLKPMTDEEWAALKAIYPEAVRVS